VLADAAKRSRTDGRAAGEAGALENGISRVLMRSRFASLICIIAVTHFKGYPRLRHQLALGQESDLQVGVDAALRRVEHMLRPHVVPIVRHDGRPFAEVSVWLGREHLYEF
jgi:hypothetical protein